MNKDELKKEIDKIDSKLDSTRYLLYKLQMNIYNLLEKGQTIDMEELYMNIVTIYEETL